MKRFITYMHEYRKGNKTKNTSYVRVDIQEEEVCLELNVLNNISHETKGEIYVIVADVSLVGIEVGTICLQDEQRKKIFINKDRIQNTEYSVSDIVGIVVVFKKNDYLASCWKDVWNEEISKAKFSILEKLNVNDAELEQKEVVQLEVEDETMGDKIFSSILYKKIELEQMRELSSANWHLCNNKFLLHGVSNYGFLFLKEEKESLWLGVPGYYEKPEMLMAMIFGFAQFEPVPKSVVDQEIGKEIDVLEEEEKNQEPKTGVFGGWFLLLDK